MNAQLVQELFVEAREAYDWFGSFSLSLENIRKRLGGHLSLGVLPSLSLSFGPEWIARLREDGSELTFELTTHYMSGKLAALSGKRVDLCLGFEQTVLDRFRTNKIGKGSC